MNAAMPWNAVERALQRHWLALAIWVARYALFRLCGLVSALCAYVGQCAAYR